MSCDFVIADVNKYLELIEDSSSLVVSQYEGVSSCTFSFAFSKYSPICLNIKKIVPFSQILMPKAKRIFFFYCRSHSLFW
jgi:hypothetical protein